MGKKILISALVVVLIAGIGVVSFAALRVSEKSEEQDTRAEVITTTREVDEKLTVVWEQLQARDEEWAALDSDSELEPTTILESATDDVAEIKATVDEARELAGEIPDEDVKAAYNAVCDELDAALDTALEEAEETRPICEAYLLCWRSLDNNVAGWNALQDSVHSCNAKNYSQAQTQAQEAQAQYEAMKTAYQQAAALSGLQEVAEGVQYAEAQLLVCAAQQELARLGSKGSVSGYNAQIERLNELEVQADSFEDAADRALGALWLKAESSYGNYDDRAIKAREMWNDVQELVAGK